MFSVFNGRKGINAFSFFIIWLLGFGILIMAAPVVAGIFDAVAPQLGSVERFVSKLFLGVITISMLVLLLKRVGGR